MRIPNTLSWLLRKSIIITSIIISTSSLASESKKKVQHEPDTVHVIAYKDNNKGKVPLNFTSSGQIITSDYIQERKYIDIDRILTVVPGVNIRTEDGYGLRPNIGIRGSRSNRSSNITILEDGTLINPAPYSTSETYFMPDPLRYSEFEVYKGGSSVQYGPRTTSGVINMITHPIDGKSTITGYTGSFGERIFNTKISQKGDNAGFTFVATQRNADGFRKIERTDKAAGLAQDDYLLKTSFNTNKDLDIYQQFDIKLAANNHDSDQSYLGLTAEDFAKNPNRQYAASQLDNIKAKHRQSELKHTLQTDNFLLTTKAYYHTWERNWARLNQVDGKSLANVLANPSAFADQLSYLKGDIDTMGGKLTMQHGARSYLSKGIQTDGTYKIKNNKIGHEIQAGARIHSDYEDRFQKVDRFDMKGGLMSLTTPGVWGNTSGNNRKSSATAFSAYTKDTITIGDFTIVPGLRYENISMQDERWANPQRSTYTKNKKTNVAIVLPSISGSYMLNEKSAVFTGIHKGFSAPTPGSDANNETSINYELGYRASSEEEKSSFEVVAYFNDYKNLLGSDTASAAGIGTGIQYNGGAVHTYGLEVVAGKTFEATDTSFPIMLTYTYTNATFRTSFKSDIPEWGIVTKGNRLPYIAEHQITLNTGAKYSKFRTNLLTRFVGSSYADAMATQKVPSHMIFDAIGHYQLNKKLETFVAIDNLTNRYYLVSYAPSGMRGGKPRTIRIGGTYSF